MRSARTMPSLALSRRSGAKGLRYFCMLLPTQATGGCLRLPAHVSLRFPLLATALAASVADPQTFRSGRNFSAWIGLVPKQHSSGGKDRLGSISKQGDRYLRSLFVAGALSVIRYAKIHGTKHRPWLTALLARRPTKVAAIALANKLARMAWAMMAKGERYRQPVALAA